MAGLGDGMLDRLKKAKDDMFSISGLTAIIMEVEKEAYDLAQTFALGGQNADTIRASLADAASEVKALGGSFNDVVATQSAVFTNLGRQVNMTSEGMTELYATTKATGVGAGELLNHFKNIGVSTYDVGENMEKVVQAARDIGVNASAVSGEAIKNMEMLNKYNFQGGVDGLARMAAQAVNLRVSIDSISNLMAKAFEPDQAIELAAKMQMLGAQQSALLDPLRLMDMAQNDPEEMMNQVAELGKQFVQFNEEAGRFEIAPGGKRQMMELAKAMDIPYDQLTKMALAGTELDDKMNKIKFPSDVADEDTQKMIANMAEMKDGQYVVKFKDENGQVLTKAIEDLTDKEIESLAQQKEEAPKTMEEIAASQLDTMESIDANIASMNKAGYAVAGGKATGDVMKTMRGGGDIAGKFVRDVQGDSDKMREGVDKAFMDNIGSINKLLSGEGSLNDVISTVSSTFGGLKTNLTENFNKAVDNAKVSLDGLTNSNNMFVELIKNATTATIGYVKEHEKLGTDNSKTDNVTTNTTTLQAQDLLIHTLPEDKLVLAAGTNLDGNNNNGQTNNTPKDINVNFKLDLTSNNPNINPQDIIKALSDTGLQGKMVSAVQQGVRNMSGAPFGNEMSNYKNNLMLGESMGIS
jgi:hypothetical protein